MGKQVRKPPAQSIELKKNHIYIDISSTVADSLVDSPLSSSGVITFKHAPSATQPLHMQDDSVLGVFDAAPLRTSTPIATDKVPEELDDLAIQMVQDLLHKHHPEIAGLQFTGLGQFTGSQLPKFASADGCRFVQVINVGDHWLCATNLFGLSSHDIYIYDSLQRKRLPDNAVIQLSAILRDDSSSEMLKIHVRKFVRQPARSRACGLYAAAAAFACCNSEDPAGMFFDVELLRDSISARILSDKADSLPGERRWKLEDISLYSTPKVYCFCHKTSRGHPMIQCSECGHWLHAQCVGEIPSAVVQNTAVPWTGPCCEHIKGNVTVQLTD